MVKKSHRSVGFEDSGDSPSYRYFQPDNTLKKTILSDEGECDDSDDNSDNVDFDDGYDEDFMGDENDRALLNAMTEVEREKELFKRMERREALKARHLIEKRLKAATTKKKSPPKDTHFNNGGVNSGRPKRNLVKSNQQSIDLIRNKRMKRKADGSMQQPSEQRQLISSTISDVDYKNKKKLSTADGRSSAYDTDSPSHVPDTSSGRKQRYLNGNFSDDSSEEEFDDTYKKKSLSPIESLEDFNKLRISRHKLTLWVHQPFFEHRIPGFFVRFANSAVPPLGDGASTSHSIYQAYEIVEVLRSNKSYKFGEYVTNKFLRVRRGNDERVIRMEYVSNQHFAENEFRSYLEGVEKDEKPKPTLEDVQKKQADMRFCIGFRPTERDIDYIVEQKNKFRKVPVNITAERHKVQVKIEVAKQKNDMPLVEKLENNLKNLDQQLELVHQNRAKQLDKIRLINERNRRSNIAQLEKVLESESTSWSSTSENSNAANNPFVRRRTNPMMLSDKKIHGHFANKLKQENSPSNDVTIDDNDKKSQIHQNTNKPTPKDNNMDNTNDTNDMNDMNKGDGEVKKNVLFSVSNPISSSSTHHPYDISKDLENLYNFELDICLDLPPQPTSNSITTSSNSSSQKQKP